ncbi:uncharacterized protein LOC123445356 [Hordeum vulgare subsp. vulgare]|uniref:uncharacterized protein LOC123445356 n=1 Tax=Hordeum vulgare subsp. vulgare TaxID=112509 RepID=UPI001D1A3BCB|nr:uncharacterized protein LOC123445356 [Hordeum vulgare subsp. vulgare]
MEGRDLGSLRRAADRPVSREGKAPPSRYVQGTTRSMESLCVEGIAPRRMRHPRGGGRSRRQTPRGISVDSCHERETNRIGSAAAADMLLFSVWLFLNREQKC